MFNLRFTFAIACTLVCTSQASADVIISNLAATPGSATAFGGGASTVYKAFGFTMGATDYSLDDVTLTMDFPNPSPQLVVSIFDNNGGSPGIEILALDNPAPATLTGQGDFVFTAGSPLTLTSGTSYWVHVRSVPTSGPAFTWTSTTPATLPTGAHATGIAYEFNGGSSSFFNKLEVNGSIGGTGVTFCDPGSVNSTGASAVLSGAFGTGTGSDLHLNVTSGVPGQLAYILVGNEVTNGVVISNGLFCLVGTSTSQFFRYNVAGTDMNSIGGFDASGMMINASGTSTTGFGFDVPSTIPAILPITIMAGDTWNFQCWYRDTPSGVGSSNFSNGLSVTF